MFVYIVCASGVIHKHHRITILVSMGGHIVGGGGRSLSIGHHGSCGQFNLELPRGIEIASSDVEMHAVRCVGTRLKTH